MQGLKIFGIISLISVYIPVLTNALFRYDLFYFLREQEKSGLEPSDLVIRYSKLGDRGSNKKRQPKTKY